MNCNTMNKKIYTFFVLVFVFCGSLFADCESDKIASLAYLDSITGVVYSIVRSSANIQGDAQVIGQLTSDAQIGSRVSSIIVSARGIPQNAEGINYFAGSVRGIVESVDCSSTNSAGMCPDLSPLVNIVSNIYDVLESISSSIDEDRLISGDILAILREVSNVAPGGYSYVNVFDSNLLSAVSNFNNDVSSSFDVLTNQLVSLRNIELNLHNFTDEWSNTIVPYFEVFIEYAENIYQDSYSIYMKLDSLFSLVSSYLPYLRTISDDLKLLVTNGTFQADYDFTNQLFSSSLLGFDRFRYYAQGQSNNNQLQLYPLSPYDTASNLRNATIYDALSSGFASLLISQGSINNYLYWLKAIAGSNRLEAVEAHLVAVSNLVGRLDDYVLGDFSNEVSRLVESLSYVTNRVDYTTNLVEIASLLQSSSNHLASIDSKLDVLDYIKVLSNTPLSDFSGDSYYDYLTNLYLNGASSASPSTNWFERIEILLASMVFGDSASSSISNEVEFTNFSEETIENAFNDYTFQSELNSGIDLVENTGGNFLTILRGFHNAIASVSQPQSIAIGLGGLDGQDTTTYEDVMHGHFQVSFNSGEVDSFTLIVRSMTTIIWILITMMFVYFSARWLLSKVLFFYRLMRTLISSLFLK